ncbi:S8 family peptidase [Microbaculum marinum]|uniref:S8 family serine peptidase n=1 Tax=Microbaculum marinum TaxID=1764581 RepID=A0AAW9S147_9HYPH
MHLPTTFAAFAAAAVSAVLACGGAANAQTALTRDGLEVAAPAQAPSPAAALRTRDSVRVIVGLAPPRPEAGRPNAPATRAAIASLQTDVIARAFGTVRATTAGGTPYAIRRMTSIAAFAATVGEAELERLEAEPRVDSISLDRKVYPRLDQSTALIQMPRAWKAPTKARGGGHAVAIVDTGVNLHHPFLKPKRIIAQACFSGYANPELSFCPNGGPVQIGGKSGGNCPMDYDDGCDHGTHVAGIAAGFNTDRAAGGPKKGVAYQSRIIAVQVFQKDEDEDEEDPDISASGDDILAALDWLYTNRAEFEVPLEAINMSIGGLAPEFGDCSDAIPPISQVIKRLRKAGIATVISSGNEGYINAVVWPACIRAAVTVGATTKATAAEPERIASYSNTGKLLDLLAPGGDYRYPVDADFPREILSSVPGKRYEGFQGTSMAAPHIAGVFTAIRSVEGCEATGVGKILKALKRTGKRVPDVVYKTKKRANVARALRRLDCAAPASRTAAAR